MMNDHRFCMLITLDGWGIEPSSSSNAVTLANTYHLDDLARTYPQSTNLNF